MRNHRHFTAVGALAILTFAGCGGVTTTTVRDAGATRGAASSTQPSDPTAAAAWEALTGPDGEYAAAASYAAVIARYGNVEPYVTIEAAEQRHIAALTRTLTRMGVSVPTNPYVGTIAAPKDLTTAATNWATGERANVAMYDRLLSQVAGHDPQLTRVLTNLRRASQDVHLPMFTAAASAGGTLTPDQMQTSHQHRWSA